MSWPPMVILPVMLTLSIRSFMRLKHRSKVDFPHPDGPMKAVTSFSSILTEIPFSA